MTLAKGKRSCSQNAIIWLCWFAYTLAYLGRYSYNANINLIIRDFETSYADAGLVTTFFFFSYGIGQVVNGILCKKYNKKFIFPFVLFASSVLNLLIITLPFSSFKYIWMLNGFLQSCLWSSIIHVLGTNLDTEHMEKALTLMSVTATIGTIFAYGSSAFFVWLGNYRFSFIFAALMMSALGMLWILLFQDNPIYSRPVEEQKQTQKKISGVGIVLGALALFAVIDNLVKDGVNTWMPTLLAENFGMKNESSILSTIILPLLGTLGALISVKLNRIIKDFVSLILVLLAVASGFLCFILFFENTNAAIMVVCCGILMCMMHAVNNVITSIAPLKMRDKVEPGKIAGILNGFCYLGSTLSAYGLGAIADRSGWDAVFYLLLSACGIGLLIGLLYTVFGKVFRKKAA